jgi:hypothetical protein
MRQSFGTAKAHGKRLDRLDQIVEILAERLLSFERLVGDLATEIRRRFDQVAASSAKPPSGSVAPMSNAAQPRSGWTN